MKKNLLIKAVIFGYLTIFYFTSCGFFPEEKEAVLNRIQISDVDNKDKPTRTKFICSEFKIDTSSAIISNSLTHNYMYQDYHDIARTEPNSMTAINDDTLFIANTFHRNILSIDLNSSTANAVYSFKDTLENPTWIHYVAGYFYIFTDLGNIYKFDKKFNLKKSNKIGSKKGRFYKFEKNKIHLWFPLDKDRYVVVDTSLNITSEKELYPSYKSMVDNIKFSYDKQSDCTSFKGFHLKGNILDTILDAGFTTCCISKSYLNVLTVDDKYKYRILRYSPLTN